MQPLRHHLSHAGSPVPAGYPSRTNGGRLGLYSIAAQSIGLLDSPGLAGKDLVIAAPDETIVKTVVTDRPMNASSGEAFTVDSRPRD